ncbi:hypothetical protein ABFX02_05G074700 [Erythranthe guttata]
MTIINIRKNPFFSNSYDAIGAYRQKRINLDSPLWLRWRLDQRVIASRETTIEDHYESLGTYYEIYGYYLLVRSIKKEVLFIYIPLEILPEWYFFPVFQILRTVPNTLLGVL